MAVLLFKVNSAIECPKRKCDHFIRMKRLPIRLQLDAVIVEHVSLHHFQFQSIWQFLVRDHVMVASCHFSARTKYGCGLCGARFRVGVDVREHRLTVHSGNAFLYISATDIGSSFVPKFANFFSGSSPSSPIDEKSFDCTFCGSPFRTKSELADHRARIHQRKFNSLFEPRCLFATVFFIVFPLLIWSLTVSFFTPSVTIQCQEKNRTHAICVGSVSHIFANWEITNRQFMKVILICLLWYSFPLGHAVGTRSFLLNWQT